MSKSDYKPLVQKVGQYLRETKGNESVISTALTQLNFMDDPRLCESLSNGTVSFTELAERPTTIYVVLPPNRLDDCKRWLRLIVTSAVKTLTATKKMNKKVLFIIDEMHTIGHLQCLASNISVASGLGLKYWCFFQNLAQVQDIYGEHGKNNILSACQFQQFFTPNDPMTEKYVSERCGEITALSNSETMGQGYGTGTTERKERLLSEYKLRDLPLNEQIILIAGKAHALRAGRTPYLSNSKYRGRYDKNPLY